MEVCTMFYICRYCIFTWWGRTSDLIWLILSNISFHSQPSSNNWFLNASKSWCHIDHDFFHDSRDLTVTRLPWWFLNLQLQTWIPQQQDTKNSHVPTRRRVLCILTRANIISASLWRGCRSRSLRLLGGESQTMYLTIPTCIPFCPIWIAGSWKHLEVNEVWNSLIVIDRFSHIAVIDNFKELFVISTFYVEESAGNVRFGLFCMFIFGRGTNCIWKMFRSDNIFNIEAHIKSE